MIIRQPPEVNFAVDRIVPLTGGGDKNSVIKQAFEHRLTQAKCPPGVRHIFHQELRFGCPYLRNPLAKRKEFAAAAEKIMAAVHAQKKIVLFGDYDCDGVTSITLLHDFLMTAKLRRENCSTFIPDRHRHGYGLSTEALASCVAAHKPELLIVLDCGTTSYAQIDWLNENKIDSVVVDHHLPDDNKSIKTVLINPKAWRKLPDEEWELKLLSAAGLSFLLVEARVERFKLTTWDKQRALLIAGLGTYVDMVPLIGINRTLVKHSLYLATVAPSAENVKSHLRSCSPGLACLEDIRQKDEFMAGPLTEITYGFYLGPCLNAPGRLYDPMDALNLLLARDETAAAELAERCFNINEKRKIIQKRATEQALEIAKKQMDSKVILLAEKAWHAGVVGIVASDVKEKFNRPVIVCAWQEEEKKGEEKEGGYWKGSGRSIEGYNMGEKIKEALALGYIFKGGGHEMAGGLSFRESQRETLEEWLNKTSGLNPDDFVHKAEIVAEAETFSAGDWNSIYLALAPFGMGNLEPSLVARGVSLTTNPTPLRRKSSDDSAKIKPITQTMLFDQATEPPPAGEPSPATETDDDVWGMRGNFEKYGRMIKIDSTNLATARTWTVGKQYNFDLVLTEWQSVYGKYFYGFRVRPIRQAGSRRNKK